jgi:hypothetical protein
VARDGARERGADGCDVEDVGVARGEGEALEVQREARFGRVWRVGARLQRGGDVVEDEGRGGCGGGHCLFLLMFLEVWRVRMLAVCVELGWGWRMEMLGVDERLVGEVGCICMYGSWYLAGVSMSHCE